MRKPKDAAGLSHTTPEVSSFFRESVSHRKPSAKTHGTGYQAAQRLDAEWLHSLE
jgi:hypothetical protein